MSRSETLAALLAAVVLLGAPLLGFVLPSSNLAVVGAVFVAILVAAVAIERHRSRQETAGATWDFIPREQYTGRFAEAGGITREEQEREIEKIQEQAAKHR